MNQFLKNLIQKFSGQNLTVSRGTMDISKTREVLTPPIREARLPSPAAQAVGGQVKVQKLAIDSLSCPYCFSKNFQKRGLRVKKLEKVQLYLCKDCGKTFTPQITKGKHYPLAVMLDALSVYNLGYSLEETCRIVQEKHAATTTVKISAAGLSNWLSEFKDNLPYLRLREFALKRYQPKDTVVTATLAHRQLYRYRFHRAKCYLMIQEDIQHRKFRPMQDFLDLVPSETPHQYFSEGERASETPLTFSKTAMIVRGKTNFATKTAAFVLQSVKDRRLRHEALQKFMLYNDSVTVATEVPVYIMRDDIEHMKTQLGFEIYQKTRSEHSENSENQISSDNQKTRRPENPTLRSSESPTLRLSEYSEFSDLPKLITGHIDILQIRNGMVHILDYKPKAEKERPIEQLTLYAMALSRLTGLRLFEFKCAWFDEKDYFEFYPLHVLHKPKSARRRRKVNTQEGTYLVNRDEKKIQKIRPTILN